ncbi:MAG: fibronectin type III domain-containing protein, partial [Thermoplasmata archaeon]|nr:fibronectin type III domain-containing protein [Thermoplasmata archaeon]
MDEVPNAGETSTLKSGMPQDTVVPAEITGETVTVIPTGNALNLTWNPSSAPDLDGYNVYMSPVSGFTPGPANLMYSGNSTYYYNDTLIDGTTYYFKVRALDDDGNEGTSGGQVGGTPADSVAPTQVTGVSITVVASGNALNLQWDNLSLTVADVEGYNIYRHTASGFSVNPIYYIASTTNLYYNETGLTDNQTYYYLITAEDEVPNEGAASTEANGTPADITAPGQVVGLIVTNPGTGNRLTLTWNVSMAADFDHYNIYRNGSFLITRLIPSYTDTGLIDNAVYIYEISAVDDGGPIPNEGVNSTAVGGTPTDTTPPAKVTSVVITVITTGNQLLLNWTASAEADFAEYWVYRNSTIQGWISLVNLTENWYLDT